MKSVSKLHSQTCQVPMCQTCFPTEQYFRLITNYGEFAICSSTLAQAKVKLVIELATERQIIDLQFISETGATEVPMDDLCMCGRADRHSH